MDEIPTRVEKLVAKLESHYGRSKAEAVRSLLRDLDGLGARGTHKLVAKLERSLKSEREFLATFREGAYARSLARAGAIPEFEPKGGKGPDLQIEFDGCWTNIEIKRLLDGGQLNWISVPDVWYNDETDPEFVPTGDDKATNKVRAVIAEATKQLICGEPNVVLLRDFSAGVTRGNFRRAVESLVDEIASNGTYGRISAVQYDSNAIVGSASDYLLWCNPRADVPLPDSVVGCLETSARRWGSERRSGTERRIAADADI